MKPLLASTPMTRREALKGSAGIIAGAGLGGLLLRAQQRTEQQQPFRKDVTQFGAVGDGATDDTEAIQAAFDAAERGDRIVIPAGEYAVSRRHYHSSLNDINVMRTRGCAVKLHDVRESSFNQLSINFCFSYTASATSRARRASKTCRCNSATKPVRRPIAPSWAAVSGTCRCAPIMPSGSDSSVAYSARRVPSQAPTPGRL